MLLAAAFRGEELPGVITPSFLKAGFRPGQSFQGSITPDGLICIHLQDRTVGLFGLNGQDLPGQKTILLGPGGPLMGADAPLIQIFLGKAGLGK